MMTTAELAGNALGAFLAEDFKRTFGSSEAHLAHEIDATAQVALECISNSDALYHNLEHTMLVTLVGRDILRGRALTEPTTRVTGRISWSPASCTTSAMSGVSFEAMMETSSR